MAENRNIGTKRLVVGAHYGAMTWLAQRITAIVMGIYTIVLLALFLTGKDFSYEGWAGMFAQQWFKLFSLVTLLALFYHAWIGVRNIFMDYIKPAAIRLLLEAAAIVWLVACAAWTAQILWRV
jgi:succinate dehydrogenase / fumarate reductase membrane anchor subunit